MKKNEKEIILSHFTLLGKKGRDRVTGMTGVISCLSFDLYGCIQVTLTPSVNKDKPDEYPKSTWFDVSRIEVLDNNPVMDHKFTGNDIILEGSKGADNNKPPMNK